MICHTEAALHRRLPLFFLLKIEHMFDIVAVQQAGMIDKGSDLSGKDIYLHRS